MDVTHLDIDISVLADWLAGQPEASYWTIEGAPTEIWRISGKLSLPSSGAELAEVLKKHGGRLRVLPPPKLPTPTTHKLDDWTFEEPDGSVTLAVAWLGDDKVSDTWLVLRDQVTEGIMREHAEA